MSEIFKKRQQLFQNGIDVGNPVGNEKSLSPEGRIQDFERGAIVYHPSYGACYLSLRVLRKWRAIASTIALDYPISDTLQTSRNDELCLFENGLIVCRFNGDDFAVAENVYRAYIGSMGDSLANFPGWIGYPLSDTRRLVSPGWMSAFEHADIYQRSFEAGCCVGGAIRERYNKLGGENAAIGLPVSDEHNLQERGQVLGRANDFEYGTIYWNAVSGAHAVGRLFLIAYQMQFGGPAGSLGMPTSEERHMPSGIRYINFQNAVLVQTRPGAILKIDYLKVTLTKLQTDEDDDDLLVKAEVVVNQSGKVQKLEKQYGEYADQGTKDDFSPDDAALGKFSINDGGAILTVNMQAFDVDGLFNGDDDLIAGFSKSFSIDTLWDTTKPDISGKSLDDWYATDEGKFRAYFRIDIDDFNIDPYDTANFIPNLWWNVNNYRVAELSKEMYAATYADVDESDSAFWHQLLAGFYQDSYRGLAAGGVCSGICVEAIYALKGRSPFRQPIAQYNEADPTDASLPDVARNYVFQLRHGYQFSSVDSENMSDLGDDIWNPIRTFNQSREMFLAGDFPILNVSTTKSDGKRSGHTLLPFHWEENATTLTIHVADPNAGSNPNKFVIDRATNTFKFTFSSFSIWKGGEGKENGGEFFAQPYHIFSDLPYTPTAAIGFDLTVFGAAGAQPRRPVFAALGIISRGNKAFFQVGGTAKVQQVFDRYEGAYFHEPGRPDGFRRMERFISLLRRDGLGASFHPNAFVLTTTTERALFFPNDLPDGIITKDKWHVSHLAALIQSYVVMPNLILSDIAPFYLTETISQVEQEAEVMRIRSRHETLRFLLENVDDRGQYHWYAASRHAQIRFETNAANAGVDTVIAEQVGKAGQLVTFQAGAVPPDLQTVKKLKAQLLNPAHNRMWVLDEMKADVGEPLSFQLNNGGNQVWIYNTNNVTDVDVQFWQNDNAQPDVYLRATPLAPNSITGFESVAPNSIKKEVYLLPGGNPTSSTNYSYLHLDCSGLVHEWLVLNQGVTGITQVSTNAPSDRPDNGGWFFCHNRIVDFCLEDGDYFITVQSGVLSLVQFTIREGVLTYPVELEGIVTGSGTNTLVLVGLSLTIDAQAVRNNLVMIPGVYGLSPDTIEQMNRPLVTGQFLPTSHDGNDGWFYWFGIDAGEAATFSFQLCLDGVVRYNAEFEGMVQGQGTNMLTILQFVAR